MSNTENNTQNNATEQPVAAEQPTEVKAKKPRAPRVRKPKSTESSIASAQPQLNINGVAGVFLSVEEYKRLSSSSSTSLKLHSDHDGVQKTITKKSSDKKKLDMSKFKPEEQTRRSKIGPITSARVKPAYRALNDEQKSALDQLASQAYEQRLASWAKPGKPRKVTRWAMFQKTFKDGYAEIRTKNPLQQEGSAAVVSTTA